MSLPSFLQQSPARSMPPGLDFRPEPASCVPAVPRSRRPIPARRTAPHEPRRLREAALLLALSLGACGGDSPRRPEDAASAPPSDHADRAADLADASADAEVEDAGVAIERIEIAVDAHIFDARAAGPSDGPLVLLLHGFPQTSAQYSEQLLALGQAGYRAVAPDQRGYSPRARPTEQQEYGVLLLAQDAIKIVDRLGREDFHLVGHDWGGGIAWAVARLAEARVRTLTVLSTPHPDAINAAISDETSCQYEASSYFDAFTSDGAFEFLRNGTDPRLSLTCLEGESLAESLAIITDDAALGAALSWYGANVKDRKFDTPPLGPIQVPTLYLWGADDPVFCRETAEASAALVSADYRFEALEGVGHWISDCVPDAVSRELLAHLAAHAD